MSGCTTCGHHSTTSSGRRLPTRPARCHHPATAFSSTPIYDGTRPHGSATSTASRACQSTSSDVSERCSHSPAIRTRTTSGGSTGLPALTGIGRWLTAPATSPELSPALVIERGRKATLQWGSPGGTRASDGRCSRNHRPVGRRSRGEVQPAHGRRPGDRSAGLPHPFWGSKRFSKRITVMQIFVAGEIAVYEYDCKGTSRQEDALTRRDSGKSATLAEAASSR